MSAISVEFPSELIEEIDRIAGGDGKHAAYLLELAERQIKLHHQAQALKDVAGAWKAEDHPELADGAYAYIRSIREGQSRATLIQEHRKSI